MGLDLKQWLLVLLIYEHLSWFVQAILGSHWQKMSSLVEPIPNFLHSILLTLCSGKLNKKSIVSYSHFPSGIGSGCNNPNDFCRSTIT